MTRKLVTIVDADSGSYIAQPDVEATIFGADIDIRVVKADHSQQLYGRIEESDVLIVWNDIDLPEPLLAGLKKCRGIVRAGVGYETVALRAAQRLGIPVCNIPDYGTEEIADHTWALILSLVRQLPRLERHCRAGGWDWRAMGSVRRLRGERLGLIGFGHIGSAVARRAHAFGLDVGFYDPSQPSGIDKAHGVKRYEALDELLENAGIISIHVNLTAETRGLIDAHAFTRMQREAILINTSRGGVIDNDAMCAALRDHLIAGVGLDVVDGEPEIPEAFRQHDRVLLTPHVAFYSDAAMEELRIKSTQTALNLLQTGQDRNIIKPQA